MSPNLLRTSSYFPRLDYLQASWERGAQQLGHIGWDGLRDKAQARMDYLQVSVQLDKSRLRTEGKMSIHNCLDESTLQKYTAASISKAERDIFNNCLCYTPRPPFLPNRHAVGRNGG